MDDAILNFRLGNTAPNRRRESRQVIRAGNENIPTPWFLGHWSGCPELGAPFSSTHYSRHPSGPSRSRNGDVYRLLHDLALAAMVVDRVQKDHSIDGFQRPLLPFLCDGENLVRDPADGGI